MKLTHFPRYAGNAAAVEDTDLRSIASMGMQRRMGSASQSENPYSDLTRKLLISVKAFLNTVRTYEIDRATGKVIHNAPTKADFGLSGIGMHHPSHPQHVFIQRVAQSIKHGHTQRQ